jgi:hypothetical protein
VNRVTAASAAELVCAQGDSESVDSELRRPVVRVDADDLIGIVRLSVEVMPSHIYGLQVHSTYVGETLEINHIANTFHY